MKMNIIEKLLRKNKKFSSIISNKSFIILKINSYFFGTTRKSFLKSSSKENLEKEISIHFDYTRHTLLQYLFMFKFNNDNIGYVIHDPSTKSLIGFDFGEFNVSSRIITNLENSLQAQFKYLFTTHSHNDHCGGNKEWKKLRGDSLIIYCGECGEIDKGDYIDVADIRLKDLETLQIGDICIACMYTPGHLKSHVVYIVTHVTKDSTKIPILFSGDTLFHGSVGKVFNGTYDELYNSIEKIQYLHYDTLLFPGHEYTISNLEFNLKLDPDNIFIKDKLEWAKKTVSEGNFTVGSRLIEEKLYNSFLRVKEQFFQNLLNEKDPLKAFIKVRLLKESLNKQI